MQGEKFITATKDNKFHINIRNLICPTGYYYMNNCTEYDSFKRFIGLYDPDFVFIDLNTMEKGIIDILEMIEESMYCPVILVASYINPEMEMVVNNSNIVYSIPDNIDKALMINTIKLVLLDFKRIKKLNEKLKIVSENYESRKIIERAKWILMEQKGITENEAYERMRKKSMNARIPMKEIAEAVIFTYNMENEKSEENSRRD